MNRLPGAVVTAAVEDAGDEFETPEAARALNEGMTKKCAPAVARIRDLHDLLGVIPHLLGFHPDESLVVLVVVDGQVQLTARADLGDLKPAGV